jgi:hypothetical protein
MTGAGGRHREKSALGRAVEDENGCIDPRACALGYESAALRAGVWNLRAFLEACLPGEVPASSRQWFADGDAYDVEIIDYHE